MVKLYTITEAAKILRFSPLTLYKWIHERKIGAVRLGTRSYRIKQKDLDLILSEGKV